MLGLVNVLKKMVFVQSQLITADNRLEEDVQVKSIRHRDWTEKSHWWLWESSIAKWNRNQPRSLFHPDSASCPWPGPLAVASGASCDASPPFGASCPEAGTFREGMPFPGSSALCPWPFCWPSGLTCRQQQLLQQTGEKTNECRNNYAYPAASINVICETNKHKLRKFLHVLHFSSVLRFFEMFRDFSRCFEIF